MRSTQREFESRLYNRTLEDSENFPILPGFRPRVPGFRAANKKENMPNCGRLVYISNPPGRALNTKKSRRSFTSVKPLSKPKSELSHGRQKAIFRRNQAGPRTAKA